jgi:CHAT domain-containing protein/Tfp pilus assembly protein PilF
MIKQLTFKIGVIGVYVSLLVFSANPVLSQPLIAEHNIQFKNAVELYINSEYEEAYREFSDLSAYYESQSEWKSLIEVLFYQANIKRIQREVDLSSRLIDKMESLLQSHLNEDHILYSYLYNGKAYRAELNLDFEDALKWAQKSVELAKNYSEDDRYAVRAFAALGYIYDSRGEYRSAIDAYKAGAGHADYIDDERDHAYSKTLVYNNLGVAFRRAGEPEKAMYYYEKNRTYQEELFHSEHPEIAMSYNNMGGIYYGMGDIARAAQYFVRAANILENNYGRNDQNVAAAYNNAGLCYLRLDEIDQALHFLEIAQQIKVNILGPDHLDTAIGHSNLASVYMIQGDSQSALENYNRSIAIRLNNYGEEHPNLVNPYLQRSKLFLRMDQPLQALEDLRQGLNIASQRLGSFHPDIVEIYIQIGHAHRAISEYEAAIANYQHAIIRVADNFDNPDYSVNPDDFTTSHPISLLNALSAKADIMSEYYLLNRDRDMLESAYNTYQLAIDLIGDLQTNFQHETSKLNLVGENFSIFEGAMLTAYNLYRLTGSEDYMQELFRITEESKARIAGELLQESEARRFAGVPDSITTYEREINAEIARLHQKLTLEKEKGDDQNEDLVRNLQNQLFEVQASQRKWIEMLEEEFPDYYEMKYSRSVLTIDEVQESLIRDDQLVLNYLLGDEHLFLMAICKDAVTIHKLTPQIDIANSVESLRESLTSGSVQSYSSAASALYDQLIAPVDKRVNNFNQLLIIPDHVLHYVPFELLLRSAPTSSRPESWPYLIQDFQVSYAPSLTVFKSMIRDDDINTNNLLALAPYINQSSGMVAEIGLRDYTDDLSPLPITRYETEEIASLFTSQRRFWNILTPRREVTLLHNDEASISRLQDLDLSDYGYIHFATHAFVHESIPSLSGIMLAHGNSDENIIYLSDIYNLRLNADLVVLSACNTGIGSLARGEGMIGFTRAFIHSGAHNLIVSMWRVSDRATSDLMVQFYRDMLNGAGKSEALRNAKLSLIERPETAFPSNWASFILMGR